MFSIPTKLKIAGIIGVSMIGTLAFAQSAKEPQQRRVTSDMVQGIENANQDRKKVLIQYHDDIETLNLAVELHYLLSKKKYTLAPMQSFKGNEKGAAPQRHSVIYKVEDSLFVITAFAQK